MGRLRNRRQPTTPETWLSEIKCAIADARETAPFGELVGHSIRDDNLFHLAPLVCLKFRGIDQRDEKIYRRVTDGALANYVANSSPDGGDQTLMQRPLLAFALCYISSHYVLDFIDEQEADDIYQHCVHQLF